MSITAKQLLVLGSYLDSLLDAWDYSAEWLMDHVTLRFDDATVTMTIEIWDMDEQDYAELKEAAQ